MAAACPSRHRCAHDRCRQHRTRCDLGSSHGGHPATPAAPGRPQRRLLHLDRDLLLCLLRLLSWRFMHSTMRDRGRCRHLRAIWLGGRVVVEHNSQRTVHQPGLCNKGGSLVGGMLLPEAVACLPRRQTSRSWRSWVLEIPHSGCPCG